jgi:hypothetical protein
MRKNFDYRVGLYIDDNECASCTFLDLCPKTYEKCNEFLGWENAMSLWQNPESDDQKVSN